MKPEHTFPSNLDEWEDSVILNSTLFTCFTFRGRGTRHTEEFKSFEEAIQAAGDDPRALVYAVAESGRFVCIPKKIKKVSYAPGENNWSRVLKLLKEKNGPK